jgi:hypothetical protein
MATYTALHKQIPNSQCATQTAISPPPGSIIAYFGGGNSAGANDPDGWVIADGTARSDAADGRYNYIANVLKIGTISGTSYTPPDLRGAFLRGARREAVSGYGTYANNIDNSAQPTPQTHATEVHAHTITDVDHGHAFYIFNDDFNDIGVPTLNRFGTFSSGAVQTHDTNVARWGFNPNEAVMNSKSGITTTNNSTTNTNANETRPYNFSVNWIIKL